MSLPPPFMLVRKMFKCQKTNKYVKIIFSLPFFWALLATLITEQFHHGVVTTIAGLKPAEHKTVIKISWYEEICVMALQDISIAVTSTHLELQLQQNGPYQPYHKCKGWMTEYLSSIKYSAK